MLVDALEYYENIAEEYDGETKSPLMLAEDIVLFDFLREEGLLRGRVLDAGCGTGLFLDQCYWPKWEIEYKGYDFSQAMLKKLGSKWPSFRPFVHEMSFLEDHDKFRDTFDVVISLYAGLNCLTRQEMSIAIQNLWSCVKKGGTLVVMTYGGIAPEKRETSLHSILPKMSYPYSMVEDHVLFSWMKSLDEVGGVILLPFSEPCPPEDLPEFSSTDNLSEITFHKHRIQENLDDAVLTGCKKGGTSSTNCSFFLSLAHKL